MSCFGAFIVGVLVVFVFVFERIAVLWNSGKEG